MLLIPISGMGGGMARSGVAAVFAAGLGHSLKLLAHGGEYWKYRNSNDA